MPNLYIVATPIGNLEDITLRAVRILSEVDVILCEDTRIAAKLLSKYNIKKPLVSYHSHSDLFKTKKIFALFEENKNLALVSDAGTPCISDPGSILVSKLREQFGEKIDIIPIPGPSACISALSASGLPASDFLFLGFLPHKKGRQTLFREIADSKRTVVLYESPHRIFQTLSSLSKFVPEKNVVLARELTKIHEEIVHGRPHEIIAYFEKHPEKCRGEFVVLIG